jgi:hypothetical protein
MTRIFALCLGLASLAACDTVPQTFPRDAVDFGRTENGQQLLRFKLSRANAFGTSPVSNAAIAERAQQICPQGYRELARTGDAYRGVSGIVYTDVEVTILCP